MKLSKIKLKEIIRQELIEAEASLPGKPSPISKPTVVTGYSITKKFKKPAKIGDGDNIRCGYEDATPRNLPKKAWGESIEENIMRRQYGLFNEEIKIEKAHVSWNCK